MLFDPGMFKAVWLSLSVLVVATVVVLTATVGASIATAVQASRKLGWRRLLVSILNGREYSTLRNQSAALGPVDGGVALEPPPNFPV